MNNQTHIVAIVQARLGSTRFPGKVLKDLCGKPMLWHVLHRLANCQAIDQIVLAIPASSENDPLEYFSIDHGYSYFRGSEDDVLSRYYEAAVEFSATLVVRVTSDCPLIDPRLIDTAIATHFASEADYTTLGFEGGFPRGVDAEVFSLESLELANRKAIRNYEREHVTPYLYQHPELFRLKQIEASGALRRPELRLTVDTEEDFQLVKEVYGELCSATSMFLLEDVIQLLDRNPALREINAHIVQKGLDE